MSDPRPEDDTPSARADVLSALIWVVFGGAIAVGSWRMDRLTHLNINRYEIPGLVPGLLGFAVAVLGMVLLLRVLRTPAAPASAASIGGVPSIGRIHWVLALMLFYALALVGRGVPFWLATFGFVASFIFLFDRERGQALGRSTVKQAALAMVYGIATSAVVTLAFERIFLVRLP